MWIDMVIVITSLFDAELLEEGFGFFLGDRRLIGEVAEILEGLVRRWLLFLLTRRRLFWKY